MKSATLVQKAKYFRRIFRGIDDGKNCTWITKRKFYIVGFDSEHVGFVTRGKTCFDFL